MAKNEANETAVAETLAPTGRSEGYAEAMSEVDAALAERKAEAAEAEPEGDEPPAEDAHVSGHDAAEAEAPAETEAGDKPTETEEPKGEPGRDGKGKFTPRTPISDALLERAVKCGIPMSEAREFQKESLLSATCARLENVQKGAGEAKPADAKKVAGEAEPADAMAEIDAIPDLNKETVEDSIVDAFAAVKAIAKRQAQEISELRGKGSKDFLATQLEGVKDFTKGDQSKTAAVTAKYEMLKKAYKAEGQDVSDVKVFSEAAQLVLGVDPMKATAKKDKADAASRRSDQRIGRAVGQRIETKSNPLDKIAAEIDAKYFKK